MRCADTTFCVIQIRYHILCHAQWYNHISYYRCRVSCTSILSVVVESSLVELFASTFKENGTPGNSSTAHASIRTGFITRRVAAESNPDAAASTAAVLYIYIYMCKSVHAHVYICIYIFTYMFGYIRISYVYQYIHQYPQLQILIKTVSC